MRGLNFKIPIDRLLAVYVAPHGVRGLKPTNTMEAQQAHEVAPRRERGLKRQYARYHGEHTVVAPHGGARVET